MPNFNPMQMLQQLAQQSAGNPQALAQQLLQKNPQFARALQGQNPEQLARQIMQQRGIDPNQIMGMFGMPKK